jgi:hypothetical protein
VALYVKGNGTKAETTEYLLNLGQVNYLITRCGLPRAEFGTAPQRGAL